MQNRLLLKLALLMAGWAGQWGKAQIFP